MDYSLKAIRRIVFLFTLNLRVKFIYIYMQGGVEGKKNSWRGHGSKKVENHCCNARVNRYSHSFMYKRGQVWSCLPLSKSFTLLNAECSGIPEELSIELDILLTGGNNLQATS